MKLEELREQIDAIDERIFDLLQQRLKFVGQVGQLKKSSAAKQYIIRPGREALKVKKAFQQAKEAGFNDKISLAIASIWREIISLSINHEEEARIAFNKNNKETLWLLREYFGPYSEQLQSVSDEESIKALQSGRANIAAFETPKVPTEDPWWLTLSKQTELNVFAAAPLFSAHGNSTLLVSRVTPEPSGEDKFIYVVTGKLPSDAADTFEVISEYKGNLLVTSDEFYNNYQSDLKARYLGCFATFEF